MGIARGATVCSSGTWCLSLDCSSGAEEAVDVGPGDDAGDTIGETEDVDVGTGVARRGVTLGVSSRLCLGETDGEVIGEDVARGIAVGAGVAVGVIVDSGVSADRAGVRGRSVALGSGVADADSFSAVVVVAGADEDVDIGGAAVVSAAGADSLAGFTNFFDGALVGVLTSDFILARAFSAS